MGGQNQLELRRLTSAGIHVIYYNGTGSDGFLTDSKIADFKASLVINTGDLVAFYSDGSSNRATSSAVGMIVKADNNDSYGVGSGSYFIAFLPGALPTSTNWKSGLEIWSDIPYNPAGNQYADGASSSKALAFDSFATFTERMDVLLEVTSSGSTLSAALWTIDGEGNALTELARVSLEGAATDAGYIGLRGALQNNGREAYSRDFQVDAIPEPSTALLLPVVGMLVYGVRHFSVKN